MLIRAVVATSLLASTVCVHALTPEQITSARALGTLREIYISGSSAQHLYLASWFKEKCNPSAFNVYFNGAGSAPRGDRYRAYACNLASSVGSYARGTPVLLVKSDLGGAADGVFPIARPINSQSFQTTMLVDSTCTPTGNPIPSGDIQAPSYACNGTLPRIADAGISEVEPSLLQQPVNRLSTVPELSRDEIGNLDSWYFNETIYGVAVNLKAYRRLQETQGLATNDDPQNQPSLPRAWIAGALRGTIVGDGGADTPLRRGWGKMIRVGDGDVESKTVNVCRGAIGSGIQAASNAYFLNAGCALDAPGVPALVPGGQITGPEGSSAATRSFSTTGTNAFSALVGGAESIEYCLGRFIEGLAGEAYGLGILPISSAPRPVGALPAVDKGYRFVKINGRSPSPENSKSGAYDFVYTSTMQWNPKVLKDVGKLSFLENLRINVGSPAVLNLADPDIKDGALSPPFTYFGALASQTDPVVIRFATGLNRYARDNRYSSDRRWLYGQLPQSCGRLRVAR